MDLPLKVPQDGTDPDFIWEEYLEETKALPAPPEAFTHVEYSLESGFKVGMKLEVPNSEDGNSYWLASVVMTCGELLSLRYAGYGDDRSGDFWFNIKSGEFHPVGWCIANNKKLWPPKGVLDRHPDVHSFLDEQLRKVESIPASLSEDLGAGFMPIEQIKCGMKVEVAEKLNPVNVWIATIIQNVGGRLLLRYDGMVDSSQDFWLFYLSDNLFTVGYAAEKKLKYLPPCAIKDKFPEEEWSRILKKSFEDASNHMFPAHVLQPKIPLEKHGFKEGMKLEAVDPVTYADICPATVSCILNQYHFLVTIDNFEDTDELERSFCCNSNSQSIFPIKWAEENHLPLRVPKGYKVKSEKFTWEEYLEVCKASPASQELFMMCCMNMGLKNGMKLEAVDPFHPDNINVATIDNIIEPLMWLHFDCNVSDNRRIIIGINSFDVFPVGWCASNGYPLQTPSVYKSKVKSISVSNTIAEESTKPSQGEIQNSTPAEQHCKSWCPKIYFNHRCFTGPLLSKSRLAELPQAIGPGPVHLVMNEVISRVVNIAYKSSRVLQILQVHGKPSPGMHQQVIKAKYKGKSYRTTIEVIRHSEQVEDFCKKICLKLECCSYLFGPRHVGEVCPSNCHTQTKTKFGYNFVKKHKKPGRPPLPSTLAALNNGEVVKRGPGRKRKRRHWTQLNNSVHHVQVANAPKSVDSSETDDGSKTEKNESSKIVDSEPNRIGLIAKKKLKHTPCSSIVTRGAKLPNFGLWHHVSSFHSRRGRPRTRPMRPFPPRKVGRPLGSTKKAIAAQLNSKKETDVETTLNTLEEKALPSVEKVSSLKSNPLDWSVDEVVKYLQETDCAPLAPLLREEEIDGQALLMLNIANVQEHLHLKPEPAKKFCYLIKNLKIEFFTHFVS